MDDLPVVVLREIFNFLSISQKLRMKSVLETMRHQKRVCIYSIGYPYGESWCFSNVCTNLYQIGEKVDAFLEEVSSLTKLKVLMIDDHTIKLRKLSSSSLEKFSLKCYYSDHIELDTPNLFSFTFWEQCDSRRQLVDLHFPLKVKYLECFDFNTNLSRLRNLATLICQKITCDFNLEDFKSLTRLELFSRDENDLWVARLIKEGA